MRKSPTRHPVREHTRDGKPIGEYQRGSGVKRQRKSRVVGRVGTETDRDVDHIFDRLYEEGKELGKQISQQMFYHGTPVPEQILKHGFQLSIDESPDIQVPGVSFAHYKSYAQAYGDDIIKVKLDIKYLFNREDEEGVNALQQYAHFQGMVEEEAMQDLGFDGWIDNTEVRVWDPEKIKIIGVKKR